MKLAKNTHISGGALSAKLKAKSEESWRRMRSAFFIFSSLLLLVVGGLSAFAADYPSAEKDIYGNTIYTNGTGEVTYRFLVSGDTQDALSSSNSVCLASNDDVALDAVFKSVWASVGGWLYSTKCGFVLLYR